MLIRHDNDIIQAIDAMMGLAPLPNHFHQKTLEDSVHSTTTNTIYNNINKRRLKTVYTQQQQQQQQPFLLVLTNY